MAHRDGGLDARGDGIDARGEGEELQVLVLLADRVAGVDFGNVRVAGGDCFFEFGFFGGFVFGGFGGLSVELFGCELEVGCC